MRNDILFNRLGWLYRLDHKKLIVAAFLFRFICASFYDCFVSLNGTDVIVPDSKFYSMRGRYVDLILRGYNETSFTKDLIPDDRASQDAFIGVVETEKGRLPVGLTESNVHGYIIGFLYFIFGYFPLAARTFNIVLSIGSAYLLFMIARRHFGDMAANIFLIAALFLPTQILYSMTLSRDIIRMFLVSLILWGIYG